MSIILHFKYLSVGMLSVTYNAVIMASDMSYYSQIDSYYFIMSL